MCTANVRSFLFWKPKVHVHQCGQRGTFGNGQTFVRRKTFFVIIIVPSTFLIFVEKSTADLIKSTTIVVVVIVVAFAFCWTNLCSSNSSITGNSSLLQQKGPLGPYDECTLYLSCTNTSYSLLSWGIAAESLIHYLYCSVATSISFLSIRFKVVIQELPVLPVPALLKCVWKGWTPIIQNYWANMILPM